MSIKPIQGSMWQDIHRIESQAYTEVESEPIEVLQSRWQVSPELCFVYEVEGGIAAYLLAHSWHSDKPPSLYVPLPQNTHGDILLIHDLAVSGKYAGYGIGKEMVEYVLTLAETRHYRKALLVSIQNSQPFWARFGFEPVAGIQADACYGANAVIMQRPLSA